MIHPQPTIITGPVGEPLTLAEVKAAVRVDHDGEDNILADFITMARQSMEQSLNRSLLTQTLELVLPSFPRRSRFYLPRSPVASVTSITYYDWQDVLQTLDLATWVTQVLSAQPAEIHLKFGYIWPPTRPRPDAVKVRYVAGTAVGDVPAMIKHAMRVMIGDWYENRSAIAVGTVVGDIPALAARNLRSQYEIPDMSGLM